jgi:hypothetical protein
MSRCPIQTHVPSWRKMAQDKDTLLRSRHFARHGHLAAADQSHSRDGVRRGTTPARSDDGGAAAGVAGDAMEARGLNGLRQGSWPAEWW